MMVMLFLIAGAAAPSLPEVKEVGKDFVVMSWQAPTSDGGAPITGYNIEAKQGADGPWVRCRVGVIL